MKRSLAWFPPGLLFSWQYDHCFGKARHHDRSHCPLIEQTQGVWSRRPREAAPLLSFLVTAPFTQLPTSLHFYKLPVYASTGLKKLNKKEKRKRKWKTNDSRNHIARDNSILKSQQWHPEADAPQITSENPLMYPVVRKPKALFYYYYKNASHSPKEAFSSYFLNVLCEAS